jgi:hypothetical protein
MLNHPNVPMIRRQESRMQTMSIPQCRAYLSYTHLRKRVETSSQSPHQTASLKSYAKVIAVPENRRAKNILSVNCAFPDAAAFIFIKMNGISPFLFPILYGGMFYCPFKIFQKCNR